jgi:ADP-ribosylglycohydrolase
MTNIQARESAVNMTNDTDTIPAHLIGGDR